MGIGITISINPDGTIEIGRNEKTIREKGTSLISIPSDYTAIDIETTGLDPSYDEIIEIGAIKVRNNKITNKFSSLVKPESEISEFIEELTGITNEMLSTAPEIENVLPDFVEFINNDTLLGHNIHFDINFLYDSLMQIYDHKLSNNFVDLMRLARKAYPDFKNHKLITIAKNLNVNIDVTHRSLADCSITHQCFQIMANKFNFDSETLKSLWKTSSSGKSQDLRNIVPEVSNFDIDHLLYDKFCTFTGKLERMARKDAAQLVVNLGGKCLNSVTKQTNFLILGNFEYNATIKDGKSSKLKKAEKLILEGQDLQILSENVFYDLIDSK